MAVVSSIVAGFIEGVVDALTAILMLFINHWWLIPAVGLLLMFCVFMRINAEDWMREHPEELARIREGHAKRLERQILEETVELAALSGWRAKMARWNRYPKLVRELDKYALLRGWGANTTSDNRPHEKGRLGWLVRWTRGPKPKETKGT